MTSINVDKFNLLYGRILSILRDADKSKELAKILYDISSDLGLSHDDVLKYVTISGLRYDNKIYEKLNAQRTNSSQLGFIDRNAIPLKLANQIQLTKNVASENNYVIDYEEPDYVE